MGAERMNAPKKTSLKFQGLADFALMPGAQLLPVVRL
jgi:hypothetical protein